jgi:hypothetical protein
MFRGLLSARAVPARAAVRVVLAAGVVAQLALGVAVLTPAATATAAGNTVLVGGTVGEAYLADLGLPANAIAIRPVSGLLPPKLSIDQGSRTLGGDPTRAGTFIFTLVYDDGGVTTRTNPYTVTIAKGQPHLQFTSTPPAKPTAGTTYQARVGGSFGSGLVIFSVDAGSSPGACTVSASGSVTFTGVGTCTVDADYPGDANYLPATQVQQSMTVGRGAQTISITTIPPGTPAVGGTYQLSAVGGGSGQPVTFGIDAASDVGTCTVSARGLVSFTSVGTCILDADQAGDANYTAATRVTQTVLVGKGGQTIRFTSTPPAEPVFGGSYRVTATGGASGEPVTFSVDAASTSGACTVDSAGRVSFTAVGRCVLDADQAGSSDYTAAAQATQTIVIGKAPQSITFTSTPPPNPVVGDTYQVTASGGGSGQNVVISIDPSANGCRVTPSGLVTFTAAGDCTILADQSGDASYTAASANQRVVVGQAPQTLTFTWTPPAHAVVGDTYRVSASGGASANPVVLSVDPSSDGVCTLETGGVVRFTGVGVCVVHADQAGDADYLAASQIEQLITVGPAPSTAADALPFTGTTAVPLLGLAASALGAGLVLLVAARGRPRQRRRR